MKKIILFFIVAAISFSETVTVEIVDFIKHDPGVSYLQTKEHGIIKADLEDMQQLIKLEESEGVIRAEIELDPDTKEIIKVIK